MRVVVVTGWTRHDRAMTLPRACEHWKWYFWGQATASFRSRSERGSIRGDEGPWNDDIWCMLLYYTR